MANVDEGFGIDLKLGNTTTPKFSDSISVKFDSAAESMTFQPGSLVFDWTSPFGYTWKLGGTSKPMTYIDPKTLKPCKHKWAPDVASMGDGWKIKPKCRKCGYVGEVSSKGVSLRKLVEQMG